MTTTPQLQLSPASFTVKIDGVTIETATWDKALSLLSQQAAIRRQPITFGVYDAGTEAKTVFTIDREGNLTGQELGTPERAAIQLSEWNISRIDGPALITFPTATAAKEHIKLVADIAKASIPVLVTGYYIQGLKMQFGADANSPASLSQEELESNLLSTEQPVPEPVEPTPEPAPTVPDGTEEPASPEEYEETELENYLFEESERLVQPKNQLWQRLSEAVRSIETPAILEPTRNKIIAGAGAAALLLSVAGISSILIAKADQPETASISKAVLSIPAGYSDQPLWSLALPEGAYVKATSAATALISDATLSLYDSDTGQKIRDITLEEPISTFGEATISGQKALIWREGNTLHAWTTAAGAEGDLITAELDPATTLSGTGQEVLALTPNTASILTDKGLQSYKLPGNYTAMAATDSGVIAGNFTSTVLTVNPDGSTAAETALMPPHEGQKIHSWKHADANLSATVWAENPDAVCEPSNKSGCNERVTVAIHALSDGQLKASYDVTLEDVAALPWVNGEGNIYGALGSYVFDEATGQQVTVLPNGLTVEKVKGHFSMATNKDGTGLVFHSNNGGYQLTSVLLAETDAAVIIQQGDRVVAYPLDVQ